MEGKKRTSLILSTLKIFLKDHLGNIPQSSGKFMPFRQSPMILRNFPEN